MTCKDCVHYEACCGWASKRYVEDSFDDCPHFKPRSRFVELPCEVGQTVYCIVFMPATNDLTVKKGFVNEIFFLRDGLVMFTVLDCEVERYANLNLTMPVENFGKTVFQSREEAEKALKERCEK